MVLSIGIPASALIHASGMVTTSLEDIHEQYPSAQRPDCPSLASAEISMKLEVTLIPVSDVDRAKRFYGNLGWRLVCRVHGQRAIR